MHLLFFSEIEACDEEEELLPISLAQTKLDRLSEPSNLVGVAEDPPVEKVPEIDTLEAHAELIKMREKLRAEQEAANDQVNLFLLNCS